MTIDRNREKLGGKVAPMPQITPLFPEHDWEASDLTHTDQRRTEQQAIKQGVNDPGIHAQLMATKQLPSPPANAPAFQPTSAEEYSGAKIVGDMVTGKDPQFVDPIEDLVGGTMMSGGAFPKPHDARVVLKDWPTDETKKFVQNAPAVGQES